MADDTIATEEAIAKDNETLDPTETSTIDNTTTEDISNEHHDFLSDADVRHEPENLEHNSYDEIEIEISNENKRGNSDLACEDFLQEHDNDNDDRRAHKIAKYEEANSHREERRDEYVRLSTNLRQLVSESLQKAVDSVHCVLKPGDDDIENNENNENSNNRPQDCFDARLGLNIPSRTRNERYAAELAREKSAECMQLHTNLKECTASNELLEQTNATLRLSVQQHQQKQFNTTEALRIAANNAANARADADAAQHRAAGYLDQFSTLKRSVEDCKKACNTVQEEHEGISIITRGLEGQLMQVQAELRKSTSMEHKKCTELVTLQHQLTSTIDMKEHLQTELDMKRTELTRWKRMDAQRVAMEQQRTERLHLLELDLSKTKHLVIQASNSTAEQEATAASLNETLAELKAENLRLHAQLQQASTNGRTSNIAYSDQLGQAEMEGQKLRMQSDAYMEEIGRFKLDAKSTEKQVQQLKNRIASLERRLSEASSSKSMDKQSSLSLSLLSSSSTSCAGNTASAPKTPTNKGVSVPPLRSSSAKHRAPLSRSLDASKSGLFVGKNTNTNNNNNGNCVLCGQTPFGLMKSCQCGDKERCKLRAHASCITRSSCGAKSSGILCGGNRKGADEEA